MSRKVWLGLVLLTGLFLYQYFQFDVLQDDAFISFRYIRNFLDGYGLVFNIGERVEGYTNFLWIILLSLLTKLGLPLIETSRALGIVAGIGTIALSAYAAHKLYPKRNWLWILSVPLLLAANGAFAYWAGSGLETGLFTLLATASAITYLTNTPLSLLLVTLATLTRPEGALLAFLFGVAGIILKQKSWKATLTYWGALALLMLPYAVFKWFYFGSLLPNPFYAKTGFSAEYWQSGIEYVGLFFKHYGLYGAVLILPLLFWKKLIIFSRFSLLIFLGYALYVVSVGGDVLKAHRFFVPVVPFLFFSFSDSAQKLLEKKWFGRPALALILLFVGFYGYRAPLAYLQAASATERALYINLGREAEFFAADPAIKTLAVSALGVISYRLLDRRVIDMLGLTEPAVARTPEKIEGLSSTWRERSYNAGYVLSQKPEVILFSTGLKPSGLAERALFLYPDFRQNYRLEFLYREGVFNNFYRRFQNRPAGTQPDQPARFVNLFNEAANYLKIDNPKSARLMHQALAAGPKDGSVLYLIQGYAYHLAGQLDSAEIYLKKGMEMDGGGSLSQFYYANLLYSQNQNLEGAKQDSILARSHPHLAEFIKYLSLMVSGGQQPLNNR